MIESDQQDILFETDKYNFDSILDIGLGNGAASGYFLKKSKKVTATGFDVKSYNIPKKVIENIKLYENLSVENMKKIPSNSFDAVWCSHVLEHTQNPGLALKEIRRVLKKGGILFLLIPPYLPYVVGGHVTPGWNIGILMYNLIMSGFNVKEGSFVKHNYNLVAFVRKGDLPKESLRYDTGDIKILSKYFPKNVFAKEKFNGNLKQVEWNWTKSNRSTIRRLKRIIMENLVSTKRFIESFLLKLNQDIKFSLKQSGTF